MRRKILIFDFDGVFYSGEHKFDLTIEQVNKNRRKFLPQLTDEQYNQFCKENPDWFDVTDGDIIAGYLFGLREKYPNWNLSGDGVWNWQNSEPYNIIIDESQVINYVFMEYLCKKYSVYILSDSSPCHIKFYMDKLHINPNWFKRIISNHFEDYDVTKCHYYKEILEKEKVDSSDVVAFGDSEEKDIVTAKKCGIKGVLVENSNDIVELVYNNIEEKHTLYDYFVKKYFRTLINCKDDKTYNDKKLKLKEIISIMDRVNKETK